MTLLTIDQAAQATGVSRDTIRRRLRSGQLPNAVRAPRTSHRDPPWLIPTSDLAKAGLTPTGTNHTPPRTRHPPTGNPEHHHTTDPHDLAIRLAAAQALADARAEHIADLRTQLTRAHDTINTLTRQTATRQPPTRPHHPEPPKHFDGPTP